MNLDHFQSLIEDTYLERDTERGIEGTFMWFTEEVGELARAIKGGDRDNLHEEFADVLAWLSTLASLSGIQLSEAAARYSGGCPKCDSIPCDCPDGSDSPPSQP